MRKFTVILVVALLLSACKSSNSTFENNGQDVTNDNVEEKVEDEGIKLLKKINEFACSNPQQLQCITIWDDSLKEDIRNYIIQNPKEELKKVRRIFANAGYDYWYLGEDYYLCITTFTRKLYLMDCRNQIQTSKEIKFSYNEEDGQVDFCSDKKYQACSAYDGTYVLKDEEFSYYKIGKIVKKFSYYEEMKDMILDRYIEESNKIFMHNASKLAYYDFESNTFQVVVEDYGGDFELYLNSLFYINTESQAVQMYLDTGEKKILVENAVSIISGESVSIKLRDESLFSPSD